MAFQINKNLEIKVGPFGLKKVDLTILGMVEKLLGRPVEWVDYRFVKRDNRKNVAIYHVISASNNRDK